MKTAASSPRGNPSKPLLTPHADLAAISCSQDLPARVRCLFTWRARVRAHCGVNAFGKCAQAGASAH
eukprot:10264833-Alexandrium_andersonii.AAC.1